LKESWDFGQDPLVALQRGDPGLFEAFVLSETPTFLAFFLRLGARRAEAEDLVQDLFLKLFRNAEHYQPKGRFAAYAFRVARNAWIDGARRRAHRPGEGRGDGGPEGDALLDARIAAPAEEPGAALAEREEVERLHAALATLGQHHRLVFELGVLQELPYGTIAEMLDIPIGTVKSRMFHAVRKLRAGLAGGEA